MKERLLAIPIAYRILGVITLVGIFFRTYNFSDWLRFNSDQARDANVVRGMIEDGVIPLLGPVAGGTAFKLGPIFYYFQYVSAKVFGAFPDVMAYPDLFFGIVAIPLSYFLFHRYFSQASALTLSFLYAVSFFTIEYSRFSWNPNSAPFWIMLFLYSILRFSDKEEKKKGRLLCLAGLSLGVSTQLHTFLLFGMPFAFFIMSVYLLKKKDICFSQIILVLIFALVMHSSQIINEIRTDGANYFQFRQALVDKSGRQNSLWENALLVISCQVQSNMKILVPLENQEACPSPFSEKYFQRLDKENNGFSEWFIFMTKSLMVIGFSGAGYILWYRSIWRAGEERRKKDLWILTLFTGVMLLVLAPFGAEVSLRYFIILAFIPFILLGFLTEAIISTHSTFLKRLIVLVLFALASYNVFFSFQTFRALEVGIPGNMTDGSMEQAKELMTSIASQSGSSEKIQIGGQRVYLGRFVKRISYFSKDFEKEIIPLNGDTVFNENIPLFVAFDGTSRKCNRGSSYKGYGKIENCIFVDEVTLLKIVQH